VSECPPWYHAGTLPGRERLGKGKRAIQEGVPSPWAVKDLRVFTVRMQNNTSLFLLPFIDLCFSGKIASIRGLNGCQCEVTAMLMLSQADIRHNLEGDSFFPSSFCPPLCSLSSSFP
jgi:hypothetical protein